MVGTGFNIDLTDLRPAALVLELGLAVGVVFLLEDINACACDRPGGPGHEPPAAGQFRDRRCIRAGMVCRALTRSSALAEKIVKAMAHPP